MSIDADSRPRERCLICISKVSSGVGTYPWSCANGHTLYRGGGATYQLPFGPSTVGPWSYRLPSRREVVEMWARRWWPDYPRVALGR